MSDQAVFDLGEIDTEFQRSPHSAMRSASPRPRRRQGFQRPAGLVAKAFNDSGMTVGVCDNLPPKCDARVVAQLADIYRQKHCDAIVAVGSRPLVEAAKAANLLLSFEGDDLGAFAGENRIPSPLKPLILAATASGSGLEASRYASLDDWAFSSLHLMPVLAVIDPVLTKDASPQEVVDLSLAALAHAIEAYAGPSKNPMADAYAYGAIGLIADNLVAVAEGKAPKTGRLALVNAAVMAACALSNTRPGMVHLLVEAAVGKWKLEPGKVMGILLPYVIEYQALKGVYQGSDLLLPLAGNNV